MTENDRLFEREEKRLRDADVRRRIQAMSKLTFDDFINKIRFAGLQMNEILRLSIERYTNAKNENERKKIGGVLIKVIPDDHFAVLAWMALPDNLLQENDIWNAAPASRQLEFMKNLWEKENKVLDQKMKEVFLLNLSRMSMEERLSMFAALPTKYKEDEEIVSILDELSQISILDLDKPELISKKWESLSPSGRVWILYRLLKGKKPTDINDDHPFVRIVLEVIKYRKSGSGRVLIPHELQEALIQCVSQLTDGGLNDVSLLPLLPSCRPKLANYCEGRIWNKQSDLALEEPVAFCPPAYRNRHNPRCCVLMPGKAAITPGTMHGARLYANLDLDWSEWSLVEVLETNGIDPVSFRRGFPENFILKLAGWANRLPELTTRLLCRHCHTPMRVEPEYARNLAGFNATVFSCKAKGTGHDLGVYINYCWACSEVIDSRENKLVIKDEKLYPRIDGAWVKGEMLACLACGSGPMKSLNYTQGDKCPKCAMSPMKSINNKTNVMVCSNNECEHEIRLPPDWARTGRR